MADTLPPMVFLGFGKYVRADRIYALERIPDEERGSGRRTRVWVDGIPEPVVASRTERTILLDLGGDAALGSALLEQALALAERLAAETEKVGPLLRRSIRSESGVDLDDLSVRARRLLEASLPGPDPQPTLFDEA